MSSKAPGRKQAPQAEPDTTGHEWDGIREWNNPLPRWWLWTFYITIIWGVAYTVAYPAWPLVSRATAGLIGYSTRAEVAADIAVVEAANAGLNERLAAADLTTVAADPELGPYAANKGAAVFRTHCAQCHGSGAAGAVGYPNLLDDDWLWGGAIDEIAYTVTHGVRNEQSADARFSQMPAFGEMLPEEEVDAVVQHVLALSGQDHDAARAALGAEVFALNCTSCHGEDARGLREYGAPNLTDAIWLYGGDEAALTETVRYARYGVMPAWSAAYRPAQGLNQAEINAVAAYVHQLGGGE